MCKEAAIAGRFKIGISQTPLLDVYSVHVRRSKLNYCFRLSGTSQRTHCLSYEDLSLRDHNHRIRTYSFKSVCNFCLILLECVNKF